VGKLETEKHIGDEHTEVGKCINREKVGGKTK